jgi:hypothetical protein
MRGTERTATLIITLSLCVLSAAGLLRADSRLPAFPFAQDIDRESGDTGLLDESRADSLESRDAPEPAVPDTVARAELPSITDSTGLRAQSVGDSLMWDVGPADSLGAQVRADSLEVHEQPTELDALIALGSPATPQVVRYGAGGTFLPSTTKWERYPTLGLSTVSSRPGFGWYFHTGLSALVLRETERAEHLLWMIDFGYGRKWLEGRGFIGLGVSLRNAGSFFEKKKEEGEESEEETDEDEPEWWWPIKDLREFAVLPQAYARIPLVGTFALEVCYALIRENRTLVGGLDVKLMFSL